MGRASNKKSKRRQLLTAGTPGAGKSSTPDIPSPFQNIILRPMNSLVTLRGKDPKQTLADGQMLVTLNRYAVVPLEHYNDLLKVAKGRGAKLVPAVDGRPLATLRPKADAVAAQPKIARPSDGDVVHTQATKVQDVTAKSVADSPAGKDPQ